MSSFDIITHLRVMCVDKNTETLYIYSFNTYGNGDLVAKANRKVLGEDGGWGGGLVFHFVYKIGH